jgi:hypothetical protein
MPTNQQVFHVVKNRVNIWDKISESRYYPSLVCTTRYAKPATHRPLILRTEVEGSSSDRGLVPSVSIFDEIEIADMCENAHYGGRPKG